MNIFISRLFLASVFFLIAILTIYGNENLTSENELYIGQEYSNAFVNPRDHPKFPNVLIIGDSISIGYTVTVRELLKGKADVFRILTNGQDTSFGLKNIEEWLGDRKWDVIHFNWGLWDITYRNPKSNNQGHRDKINGIITTTPSQYKENMSKIVQKLKGTNAKLIWCSTTPVPKFDVGRKEGDELIYNEIAKEIMIKNDVFINNLHSHALQKLPLIQQKKGDVHYTQKGYDYLAQKVAQSIISQLTIDDSNSIHMEAVNDVRK